MEQSNQQRVRCYQNPGGCNDTSRQHLYRYHKETIKINDVEFKREGLVWICPTEGCTTKIGTTGGFQKHVEKCVFNVWILLIIGKSYRIRQPNIRH